ncbi:hypothetical protein T12_4017 [Trichinella patagoniensis]|uniref:Secreted protein n=1 Tax=Trichinella patagoniensis TaxID=990121 RepID=A0A0V0ZHP0_9BILA|nr:hypothetical protein T12_4017 [Trichinella patagoniensis]
MSCSLLGYVIYLGNWDVLIFLCTSGNGDCVQLAPPTGRWSGLRTGLASQLPAGGLHPVASVFIFDWAETSSSPSSLILFRRFS